MQNENHRGSYKASCGEESHGDDDDDRSRCRTHLARARSAKELFRGPRQSNSDSRGRVNSRDDDGRGRESCKFSTGIYSISNVSGRS